MGRLLNLAMAAIAEAPKKSAPIADAPSRGLDPEEPLSHEAADRPVAPLMDAQERAREGVLGDLRDLPHLKRALRYRREGDTVIITIGIRDVGTGELSVPAEKFDLTTLLAYLNGAHQ